MRTSDPASAQQAVVAGARLLPVVAEPALDAVRSVMGLEQVVPAGTVDPVVAAEAHDLFGRTAADDLVRHARPGDHVDVEDVVGDVGRLPVVREPVDSDLHRAGGARGVADGVGARTARHGVAAGADGERVVAEIADELVRAEAARERVVAGTAEQQVVEVTTDERVVTGAAVDDPGGVRRAAACRHHCRRRGPRGRSKGCRPA